MKILAMGDVHCRVDTTDLITSLIGELDHSLDVLVLAGDLTDSGLPEEAEVLVQQLKKYTLPIIAILGNHDHEGDRPDEITAVLRDAGIIMLDGTVCEVGDVGFVGTKGFCGGFDQNSVQPFGEAAMKTFIRSSIDEALVLESALQTLQHCRQKVAVLHYSPIRTTLVGEPPELFPFLGTSRLAEAIDRHGADLILHGHAHHGSPFGRTAGDIPVYNVSRFVQMEHSHLPYCVIEI